MGQNRLAVLPWQDEHPEGWKASLCLWHAEQSAEVAVCGATLAEVFVLEGDDVRASWHSWQMLENGAVESAYGPVRVVSEPVVLSVKTIAVFSGAAARPSPRCAVPSSCTVEPLS